MAYSVWQRFITDGGEKIVASALISVYSEDSGAPAAIYDGPSGSPIGNTTILYVPAGAKKRARPVMSEVVVFPIGEPLGPSYIVAGAPESSL